MRTILIVACGVIFTQALFMAGYTLAGVQEDTMNEFDLKTYTHGPISGGAPKQLVILLHGLGSDGRDLIGLAPLYAQALPDAVFVSPDAPHPCDMAPMGYQWFSLQDRAPDAMLTGVQRMAPILDHFITAQIEKYDVPADRTVLIGFSQGTMMSLYVGPRYPEKLAGILGYSGALVGEEGLDSQDIFRIPVHLVHGDQDDVVPVDQYYHAETTLKNTKFAVSGGVTSGLTHSIDEAGIASGSQFLSLVLN